MLKLTLSLGLAALAGYALASSALADDPGKSKTSPLEGGYTIISGEKFGKPIPASEIEGTTVRWTADRAVVTDKDKKEVYGSTYTLKGVDGPGPWTITMVSKLAEKEETAKGLVEKDGDTIRLIYALPGGAMPSEFKTTEKQLMFVMKNERKEKKSTATTKTID